MTMYNDMPKLHMYHQSIMLQNAHTQPGVHSSTFKSTRIYVKRKKEYISKSV